MLMETHSRVYNYQLKHCEGHFCKSFLTKEPDPEQRRVEAEGAGGDT